MRPILTLLCLLFLQPIFAQKVLQIEKFGDPVTEKINIGAFLTYQLKNDDIWSQGYIRDFRIDLDVIELDDRFVNINDIAAFQYRRTWPKKVGTQLALFGLAWSGYALIGTLTDNNPDTNYQWSDAIVTGAAAGIGLSLPLVFGKKTIRFDKRRRLRMLDITF